MRKLLLLPYSYVKWSLWKWFSQWNGWRRMTGREKSMWWRKSAGIWREQTNKTYAQWRITNATSNYSLYSRYTLCGNVCVVTVVCARKRFLRCFCFRASRKDVSRYGIIMWPEIVSGGRRRYAAATATASVAADTIKRQSTRATKRTELVNVSENH